MRNAEIHKQRMFFDNRKDISKIVVLKIQTMSICIHASSTHVLLVFLKKYQDLNYWWYFKVSQANCLWVDFSRCWQFWGILGRFCRIVDG
jgi:hypothetical protein